MNGEVYDNKITELIRAIDGDTIVARLDLGYRVDVRPYIRLTNVNTPERGKPGYNECRIYVERWFENCFAPRIRSVGKTTFDRWLGHVYDGETGGVLADALWYYMVVNGWDDVADWNPERS